jgi:hypothetical protein
MTSETPKGIQTWIHFLEEGAGQLWLERFLLAVIFGVVVVVFHFMEARNFAAPEAMDQAQVARNLAEGRGFTTWNVRPLSVHYRQQTLKAQQRAGTAIPLGGHPDLENAPVFPVLEAALFKALPIGTRYAPAAPPAAIHRIPAEMAVSWMNIGLLMVLAYQVYRLGCRIFDPVVGAIAAAITCGTDLIWRFAYSGLSTLLIMVMLLALARVLVSLEARSRPDALPARLGPVSLSVLAGLLLGVLCLTRYSVGWLILPTAIFVGVVAGARRWLSVGALVAVFLLVLSPWVARNMKLSGLPFGTATCAIFAGTDSYPDDRLTRSLLPNVQGVAWGEIVSKGINGSIQQFEEELPRLGGSWLTSFFLVSLLLPFRNPTLSRLRGLSVGCLGVLFLAQAFGRTHLSTLSPEVTSENLLVLLAPLVFLYGAGLLHTLFDSLEFPFPLMKSLAQGAAVVVLCLPLIFALASSGLAIGGLIPRRHLPMVDPPYRPDVIRDLIGTSPVGSLMMSDIPWAVAWYGNRECVGLPLRIKNAYKEDFFAIHDQERPVAGLYLSPLLCNSPMQKSYFQKGLLGQFDDKQAGDPWFDFYLNVALRGKVFAVPMKFVYGPGFAEEGHLFCTEQEWWNFRSRR